MKSSWLRHLLIGLGVFVLLASAVLAYLVASFDANAYKGYAIDWMKTRHGRTLVIDGPVKLAVLPRLALQVSGVKLSEKDSTDEFAALQEADLSVSLLPLLTRHVVVDRIEARGLVLNYRRSAKGASNLDDIATAPAQPASSGAASSTLGFEIHKLQLRDVRVKLRDEQRAWAGELTLASLSSGRLADREESPVSLDMQVAMTSPPVQGRLTGSARLAPDFAAQGLRLQDLQLVWTGQAGSTQGIDAKLRGKLAYDGKAGALHAESLELSGSASFGAFKLGPSSLSVQRFAYEPKDRRLQLSALRAQLAGTQAGQPVRLSLDWPELSVRQDALGGSALNGQLRLEGPTALEASFKTAPPTGSFERPALPGVEADLKGRSGPHAWSGSVRANLQALSDKGSLALESLDAKLQLQQAGSAPLELALQGKADISSQAAHWAVKGRLDAGAFSSDGSLVLVTDPPTLDTTARIEVLDLNRLMPAPAAATPATASTGPAPDTPVDMSALRALQGRFSVQVGRFAYRDYRVGDLGAAGTLEGGMLRLSQVAGTAWSGKFNASALADARASRIALKGTASGVNVNALLKDVARKDVLEGTGRVVLDIDTAGRSTGEMKSRLQGSAAVQLRDGAIKGVNLAKRLRQAKAVLAMKPADERQQASQTEKTDFSELSASFSMADGVARSSDLDAKSPFLRLGGEGVLDIGKGRIDYTLRATVAPTSKGQDGAELAALKGMTVPVQLSGPFEAMDWRIQWSAVASQALKTEAGQQVKDRVKEKLGLQAPSGAASTAGNAKDKLKERLKGLFK